jgi:ubiquinone/menaquinone biosynthesis C-methylase UbiE
MVGIDPCGAGLMQDRIAEPKMTNAFAHDTRQLAETYDRVSDGQLEGGKRIVERLALAHGARVLDVGCGTGRLAQWIAERVGTAGSVTGVDPLKERVDIARAKSPGLRFEIAQAEDLGVFEDASFDAVCMASVFHWISDKAKALAEVRRVLRPGGRLGVTTFPHELAHAGTVARVFEPLLRSPRYAEHVDLSVLPFGRRRATTTDMVTMVIESGLELVELHINERLRKQPTGEAFVDFLDASSFGNFLRIVPEGLRASLRAELAAGLEAKRGPDGVVARDWGVLFVAARV